MLKKMLTRAYALIQNPEKNELLGVWEHHGTGLYPGNWNLTCEVLSKNGITDIFSNMLWSGLAHYDSKILPKSQTYTLYGDQLKQCIEAAHRNGLQVHAWKICWKFENAPEDLKEKMKKQGRLMVSKQGQTVYWLCPSHPENMQWEKDSIREIVHNYDVDGIHLDYIRYINSHYCFCHGCRTRFTAATGRTLNNWPADVLSGDLRKEYNRWRCSHINSLVRDISALTRKTDPSIKISAAVFGKYPSCRESVAQDWPTWLKNNYVDFLCPMNYTSDMNRFTQYVKEQLEHTCLKAKIHPGIGVSTKECRLSPVQVIDQINILRTQGAKGFILFDLDKTLEFETLPMLSLGISAE
jgi:uncharacterized lipoprotein YddW (UPF0748 family)